MKTKKPNSLRKCLRGEKARIRREVPDMETQHELVEELYKKYFSKNDHSRNIQPSGK